MQDIVEKERVPLHLQTLYLRISKDQYHFLKFILEGYDGLALLSKDKEDIVRILYPIEMYDDLILLLGSVSRRIRSTGPDCN
jgi:hypothetical protein